MSVIIYPPTFDWGWMKQRPQHLMEQFSLHGFEVYYCNKTQSNTNPSTTLHSNLTIIHNQDFFIKKIIPRLKNQGKQIILWVSWPKHQAFLDLYRPDFIIYDYLDDFPAWKQDHKPMVNKSNIVITTSRVLQTQMEKEFPDKRSYLIPNGCDVNHFKPRSRTQKPGELELHDGPIITYSGAWASWVDNDLVRKIANAFKDTLVIVIGSQLCHFSNTDIANLKFLGHKPYQELPGYLHYSTVCIIPFLLGQITRAASPIKMYEYLASGKPVVSTDIPEARDIASVHIGVDHTSFIEKVRSILDRETIFNEDEVYHWLASHTWEKRFEEILALLCTPGLS